MQAAQAPRTSVLLVDDQPSDLLALERHLSPFELHLVTARSGEEALDRVKDEDFALVLMDVRMPGLDGLETARLLREHEPKRRSVPLIFLTGASREEMSVAHGYSTGAVDWLRKPVEPETLRAKVRVFVDLHREREALRRQQAELHEREREMLEESRRRAEEALRESQRTLSTLMDNLPGMVFRRHPDQTFALVSEGCLWLTGYSAPEFVQGTLRWTDLLHPEDLGRVELAAAEAFAAGRQLTVTYRIQTREGGVKWVWERAVGVYHPEGTLRFIEGFAADISERKAAEVERERLVTELREAVRLREEFLSVASHEMRTPLTPLALRLQLLQQAMKEKGPGLEPLNRHVEAARGQVRRLTSLADSLLDATRISSGRLTLRLEEDVDLAALVRNVATDFETQAARVDCPLVVEAAGRIPGRWDVLRLEQVVTNLLSNALKFGAGRAVHLRVEEREGWARLTVRDEGIGMDESVRTRVFGRFERGVSERHYGGLGLGLYITREVVETLGGRIHVESEPGRGATFTVELPCTPPLQ
ncbi:sensor histidine kinase [Archangium lipolyticum]|uniref:sensor histidine kinase n=1 Tax=Archangium lipolyticum TaxID=2970465 RepID=UPI0027D463BB|nr:ATP-binding protein [Archangium lipolyticum]